MKNGFSKITFLALGALIIASASAFAQQGARKIAKIEVEGLQRLSADDVIATTGLHPGATFSVTDVDAAAQKLVDSGLFSKISYRTITTRNQVTLIFQLVEAKSTQSRVVFDNFVWFTDEELTAAIKRDVPSYTGTAPDAGNMTDLIKAALQKLLDEKQIKGKVEYSPWQGSLSAKQEHLYSVSGLPIPICSLHFPGAKNIHEEKLIRSSRQLTEADYSNKSAIAFGTYILYPLYRDVGQLRATFADPIAKFENSERCKGGVHLTIPIDEGPIYLWSEPQWLGNQALKPVALNEALGMKEGEPASGSKLDKGLIEVKKAYGRVGHLNAEVRAAPHFNDAASRVTYSIDVTEGPQYRMGKLTIKGLSEGYTAALEEKWRLESGAIFNNGYLDQFLRVDAMQVLQGIVLGRQTEGKGPPHIARQVKPNRATLTADVTLEFKDFPEE